MDEAVAAAFGWPGNIAEDEVLRTLLDWNVGRAGSEANDNGEDEPPEEVEEDKLSEVRVSHRALCSRGVLSSLL